MIQTKIVYTDRYEDAVKMAYWMMDDGDSRAFDSLPELEKRIDEDYITCDCQECGQWDGLSKRCDCNNRRVAWAWDDKRGWEVEVY